MFFFSMLLHVPNEKQPMEGEENSNYQFREFAEFIHQYCAV